MITFEAMQQRFAQVWDERKLLPTSITIAETDYQSLAQSLFPAHEWSDFEKDLLGETRLAELDAPRLQALRPGNIAYIINHVNCRMVKLILNSELAPGTIILSEAEV